MKLFNLAAAAAVLFLGLAAQAYTNIQASRLDCRYGNIPGSTCTTEISWDTSRGGGVITVEVVGTDDPSERRQKLFACGDYGRQSANWIRKRGDTYIFRLYEGVRCPGHTYPNQYELGYEADRVSVRYNGGYGDDDDYNNYDSDLQASRLRPLNNGLFSTSIKWQKSAQRGTGVITVEMVGAQGPREKLFACGDDGVQRADWIQPGYNYIFRLYEGKRCPEGVTYPDRRQLGTETRRVNVRVR